MAKAPKFQMPDLSNATPEFLADEMGKLAAMESHIKKMRGVYKEAYFSRLGIDPTDEEQGTTTFSGELFTATTTPSHPRRVSISRLKEQYPDIAEEVTEDNFQLTTRFKLNEGVNNPVVNDLLNQLKNELGLDD